MFEVLPATIETVMTILEVILCYVDVIPC